MSSRAASSVRSASMSFSSPPMVCVHQYRQHLDIAVYAASLHKGVRCCVLVRRPQKPQISR